MRLRLTFLFLLCCSLLPRAVAGEPLERGLAVIDPSALRELDRGVSTSEAARPGFGVGRFLRPDHLNDTAMADDALFALPSMAPVRKALDAEFDRYTASIRASFPNETIGVGSSFDFQLFDREALYSERTRFVLSGIVNRMDRAYVAPDICGEIRVIYRLTRVATGAGGGEAALSPRLPMTLNIVLKARNEKADATSPSCAEIARRWLAISALPLTGAELADRLLAEDGPLASIKPDDIDRIETNLQIAHAPKSEHRDFRTDYLLKVFRYVGSTKKFEEAPLENQIDRDRILTDDALKQDFRRWLLDPKQIVELDRGTILIPERFLAAGAVAATPVPLGRSDLQPAFGLVQSDRDDDHAVFQESDVVAALAKATERGVVLQNIRSPAGFERRLNDITCTGCHQTRGIGGFHFPGVDWMAANPSNSTVVPGSPHFFGDQVRRRDILAAVRDGRRPDYSRGFSDRPQLRHTTELLGTEYYDGWGSHCYQRHPKVADNDRSFQGWSCAAGLTCQATTAVGQPSRMGMCFVRDR